VLFMEKAIELTGVNGLLVRDLGLLPASGEGCILELAVTLEGVRPETRTALALTLTELDERDREFPRGVRTLLIPAHHNEGATDITVRDIRFILPAELNVGGDGGRRLRVRYERQCVDCPAVCEYPME
jgi:Ca-activated chloride channel family protein